MNEEDASMLLYHLKTRCSNCETEYTPQWRKGWYNYVIGKYVKLCNACGIKFSKDRFCEGCYEITGSPTKGLSMGWSKCKKCKRSFHEEHEMYHECIF